LSLRVRGSGAEGLRAVSGLPLDLPITRFSAAGDRLAARLGPDEWLIIGTPAQADSLGSEIAGAVAGRLHAFVDVSQASVAFAVEGSDAANILNTGCPLDFDTRQFPAGSATRTVLGKCEVIIFRLNELEFRVECWRSFGEYVHSFLLEAAALNGSAPAQTKELHS
jgi:sarcosine oxidase subunit gamma